MREKSLGQGETLFREGEEGNEAFRILEGRIEISIHVAGQGDIPLGHLVPGDIFGEMALLDDKPRSATARALEPTRLHVMNVEEFNDLFLSDPSALAPFLSSFFERLRNTNELLRRELESRKVTPNKVHQLLEQGAAAGSDEAIHPLPKITLTPGNKETRKAGAPQVVVLDRLPFRIGRRQGGKEPISSRPTISPCATSTLTKFPVTIAPSSGLAQNWWCGIAAALSVRF